MANVFKPYLYYEPYTRILSTDPIKYFKYVFEIKAEKNGDWNVLYEGEDHFMKVKKYKVSHIVRVYLIPSEEKKNRYNYQPSNEIRLFDYKNF